MSESWRDLFSHYSRTQLAIGDTSTWIVADASATQIDRLVVLLHGFGAPREDLVDLAGPLLAACLRQGVRPVFAFPGAPLDLPDVGPGSAAWWPLNVAQLMAMAETETFDRLRHVEPPGLGSARDVLVPVLKSLRERYVVDDAHFILGGFSQGAMLSVDTAIRGLDTPPGGLIVWSGACICEPSWQAACSGRMNGTRVVQSHGRRDPILPLQTGRWLKDLLSGCCKSVDWIEFDGFHQIPNPAVEAAARLIIGGEINREGQNG